MANKESHPADPPAATPVSVPLTDAERITYQKAAERSGLSLTDWIRNRLAEAAKREAKDS